MALSRRRVTLLLTLPLFAVGTWLALSVAVAWKMTRRTPLLAAEASATIDGRTPRDVRLETSDGETCGAWYLPGDDAAPGVVLLHGNGGTRAATLPVAEILTGQGCAVLCVTQRAHGDSTGDVNDFGWSAARDVIAAVAFLERERPGCRIVVRGSSLGAAAAVFAAGELADRVDGYVLECVYVDLATAVGNRTRMRLPAPLAALAATGLEWTAPLVLGDVDRIAPVRAVTAMPDAMPLLVLAGGLDRHATVAEARAIVAAAAHTAARLVVFEDGGHESLLTSDPPRYAAELTDFVSGVRGRPQRR